MPDASLGERIRQPRNERSLGTHDHKRHTFLAAERDDGGMISRIDRTQVATSAIPGFPGAQ